LQGINCNLNVQERGKGRLVRYVAEVVTVVGAS